VIDKIIGCRARNAVQSEPQNKTAKSFPNNHNSHYARSMVEKVLTKNQEKYKSDVNITPQYQGVSSKSFIYGQ
jgi:hypothetical protein